VTFIVESKRSGASVSQDVDLVPIAVVQAAVRRAKTESATSQVKMQIQKSFEQLQREEITLQRLQ
jgi:hypothetical protein